MMEPKIIFEDTHLVVLDKPPGLLSQGDHRNEENLVDWLRTYFGRNYVGLVHRLDRNTSGVMVVAKRSKSANRLTESIQKNELKRTYLAILMGKIEGKKQWTHFLVKDKAKNQVKAVDSTHPEGKKSELILRPLNQIETGQESLTLCQIQILTGRSHQIRVQSAEAGHPLLGDPKYGVPSDLIRRPALHSHTIEFPHPMGGKQMHFKAELPEDFKTLTGVAGPIN